MYINKGNVNVNEGKEVGLGLVVGDDNNCMQVDGTSSSAHCCGCLAYGRSCYGSMLSVY